MTKQKGKVWQMSQEKKRASKLYRPDGPPIKTPDQTAVERWLELADAALEKNDDPDPSPSAD
ncbi:MAG TPA: hypothetical protein VFZ99_08565 [Terriglobales bacterium]